MIFAIENSNQFQKAKFWKEKSIADMVTFEPMTKTTLIVTWSTKATKKQLAKNDPFVKVRKWCHESLSNSLSSTTTLVNVKMVNTSIGLKRAIILEEEF